MKPALFVMLVAGVANAQSVQRALIGKQLTLDIDAAPLPNLTYQLDCMAKLMPCSADAYRALWSEWQWSADDEKALATWAEIHQRYQGSIRLRDERRSNLGYPLEPRGPNVASRLRHAGLVATDIASYRSHLALLVLPADADAATQVLTRFWPRFEKWWKTKALKQLSSFLQAMTTLIAKKDLLTFIEKAESFYEADLPSGFHIPMHLMFRPVGKGATHGQQLEQHSIVEVVEGEKPEGRVDVVAHELFHFFFWSRSGPKTEALMKAFIDAPAPESLMALGLLNEALATALGNGLVAKRVLTTEKFDAQLKKPNALYNDPAIDSDAKQLLTPVEMLLAEGKTISSAEFVNAQIGAASANGATPSHYLRTMQLFFDPEFTDVTGALRRAVFANSVWSSCPLAHPQTIETLNEAPLLSGVVLVAPTQLSHLSTWPQLNQKTRDALAAEAKRGAPFIYAVKRGEKAWLWVLVAADSAAMTTLIERLPCAPAPVEGVVSSAECVTR